MTRRRSAPHAPVADTALVLRLGGGTAVWLLVAALSVVAPRLGLTLLEVMALLGPLVLAPAALALLRPATTGRGPHRLAEVAQPAGALAATLAVLTAQGSPTGALLAGVWLLVALIAAVPQALAWIRSPTADPVAVAEVAALAFLVVGAAWLVVDRLGATPFGLDGALVILTAVHFHTAGLATSTIAARTVAATRPAAPRAGVVAVWAIVAGPVLVAVGFAYLRPLQLAGALVLTGGLYVLAWLLLVHARPADRTARALLVLAGVAVVVPMGLAVQWAAGEVLRTPALSVPTMARTHGLVNAFGFTVPGLAGWLLAARAVRQPGRRTGRTHRRT